MNTIFYYLFISSKIICLLLSSGHCSKLADDCGNNGLNFTKSSFRIVGGEQTKPGEFPWQIRMVRFWTDIEGNRFTGTCSGTIINQHWILTAAHCINDLDPKQYTITLGEYDVTDTHSDKRITSKVSKVVRHQYWDHDKMINDIALLKLETQLDFAVKHKHLKPICIPKPKNDTTTNCYISGWGEEYENGPHSNILSKVEEPIFDMKTCSVIMAPFVSQTLNICAGGTSLSHGTCTGDSGGPLQCRSSDGKWYQTGIISWGNPCAHPNYPDVFTKVSAYRTWIEDSIIND